MLKQLLVKSQDKLQLFIAMIGSFLGITFLVLSIHYLIRVNEYGRGSEILGPNTLIVGKPVKAASLVGLGKTDFSMSEIEKLKQKPFISDVKPVISNNFDVSFQTDDRQVPYFRSDVFIQTVDQSFLDVKSDKWQWKEGDSIVPIILPRDFLVMLNTFMSSNGIPQVSDELAKQIHFKFTLSNETTKEFIGARIIGFTNEVPAILVPKAFMDYGNSKFANGKEQQITQIMIAGKESEFGLVEEYIQQHGLETKNSQIVIGRLKSIVSTLIIVILAISVIAVFTSGLVLIQYLQLLISNNVYEVRTLIRLGVHPKKIVATFFQYLLFIFGTISIVGVGVFYLVKLYLDHVFSAGGLQLNKDIAWLSIAAVFFAYILFALASYFSAKRRVFKEY